MKTLGEFIHERRIRRGLSARQLAERAGVSDAHVFYIEKGLRKPTFQKVMDLLEALGSSVEELLRETGAAETDIGAALAEGLHSIPVVSWVTAGRWREVSDEFEPGDADQWISTDVKGRNIFALRVQGDSMEPEFAEGEIIIVSPHLEAQPGNYVIVKNPEGEATFKQLKKFGTSWVLHPLNPNYQDIEVAEGQFKIIGKVVKKEKRY